MFSWLLTLLWGLIKYILHILTGKSELERICSSHQPHINDYSSFKEFETCLINSKQLSSILEESYDKETKTNLKYLNKKFIDSDEVFGKIKQIKKDSFKTNEHSIKKCKIYIKYMININQTIQYFYELSNTKFDIENGKDLNMLFDIWKVLKPKTEIKLEDNLIISNDWKEIGFQGKDPRTDFRGMGILGLMNLHYFVMNYQKEAKQVLEESDLGDQWYPFAICGINITGTLVDLISKYYLNETFYKIDCELDIEHHRQVITNIFQNIYAKLFVKLHDYYIEQNGTVMKFNTIKDNFFKSPSTQQLLASFK
ncbi:hypothetical protein ABK040_006788 [Willaertia magna]